MPDRTDTVGLHRRSNIGISQLQILVRESTFPSVDAQQPQPACQCVLPTRGNSFLLHLPGKPPRQFEDDKPDVGGVVMPHFCYRNALL